MTTFTPPQGQRCQSCRCFDPYGAAAIGLSAEMGICRADKREVAMGSDEWCWRWTGSAAVRCGECKWFAEGECPRVALGHAAEIASTPSVDAFACERWEAPE